MKVGRTVLGAGVAVTLGFSLAACGGTASGTLRHAQSAAVGVLPGYQSLTPHQHLEKSLSVPGMLGAVYGEVLSNATQRTLPDIPGSIKARQVSDAPFRILGSYGFRHASPYSTNSTVTIQVSALASGEGSEFPVVTLQAGQQLLVFAQNNAATAPAGATTTSTLSVSSTGDVAFVKDSTVTWGQLTTTFADFTSTLEQHPSPS